MEITRGGSLPPPPQTQLPLPEAVPGQPLARPLSGVLEALILAIDPPTRVAQGNSANYSIDIALSGERLRVASSSYFPPGSRLLVRALSDSRLRVDQVLPAPSPVLVKTALRNALPAQLPVRDALLAIRELGGDAALPGPIRQRIAELLMRLPSPAQAQSPRGLRELLMNSGLLLEGRLRASAAAAPQGSTSAAQAKLSAVPAPAGVHSSGQARIPGSAPPSGQSPAPADDLQTVPGTTLNPAQGNVASSLAGGSLYAILRLLQRFSGAAPGPTAPSPAQLSSASGSHTPTATYDARGQLGTPGASSRPGASLTGTVVPGMESAPADSAPSARAGVIQSGGGSASAIRGEASAAVQRSANSGVDAPMPRGASGIVASNNAPGRPAGLPAAVKAAVSMREGYGSPTSSTAPTASTRPVASPGLAGDPRNAAPVDPVGPRMLAHDFKAQLLGLLELLEAWPSATRSPAATQNHSGASTQPGLPTPLLYTPRGQLNPGISGALPGATSGSARPPSHASGQPGGRADEAAPDVQRLLIKYVEAALARTRIHQIAGLPETRQANDSAPLASWTVEIPLQRGQQLDLLEMHVEDHGEHPLAEGQPLRLWRLMMTLDIETLGPMHAWLQLAGKRLSATLWAERSSTLDAARSTLRSLVDALETQGVEVAELECKAGRPPASQAPRFERLLDVQT